MKIKEKRKLLAHEMFIARFSCSVIPCSVILVAFTNAYIIHTENFNNTSLIIVCTDF